MSVRGSIVGRVINAAGAPVAGATVVIAEGDQPHPEIGAITDAGGAFRFGQILPGGYRLAAHLEQHKGSSHVVVREGQEAGMEIRLLGETVMSVRGSIVGRVVTAAGAPVPGATVVIAEGDQPYPEIGAITDAGGAFRFGQILPGSYRLAAHLQQRSGSSHLVVREGQQADTEIRLP
jgi:protocatechuate 3,4-dioxygenase beta subunit